jgi:DHA1 family tetracycline resistance protein-like MFS transporter
MDNQLLMNAQLSHAESQARSTQPHLRKIRPLRDLSGQKVMLILAVCMALQMTGFVLILPLFARRFSQLGAGVQALSESAMAYALAATLAAPFMGALADRFGRRRIVLASLGIYILAFTGYLFAPSAAWFILLRGLAGAFTAGLIPAVTGIVADIAPVDRRAQWIGIVNGGASIGWIAGPILGGVLYDRWGYGPALGVSIFLALAAFLVACLMVPETRKPFLRSEILPEKPKSAFGLERLTAWLHSFRLSLPNSLSAFSLLLWIYFAVMFAWAFIDPRLQFYAYDDLGWSSSQLGLMMSVYGISLTLGEFSLSRLSDRLGRKPVVLLGLALFSAQFLGLAIFRNTLPIAVAFLIAGLGNALYDPAISASILDLAPAGHQARLLGIKSTAGSLGSILGPGLVVLFTAWLPARGIFMIAFAIAVLTALLTLAGRLTVKPAPKASSPAPEKTEPFQPYSVDQGESEP